jgi:hypothetical protein
MRALIVATVLSASLFSHAAMAQSPPTTATASTHYTTGDTTIGTILDDPAAHAIVDKHLPGILSGDQINMARTMTLKGIQPFAGDKITDKALADIDAEFANLPPKK